MDKPAITEDGAFLPRIPKNPIDGARFSNCITSLTSFLPRIPLSSSNE